MLPIEERQFFITGIYLWPVVMGMLGVILSVLFNNLEFAENILGIALFITSITLMFSMVFYVPYIIFIAISHSYLCKDSLPVLIKAWKYSPIVFGLVCYIITFIYLNITTDKEGLKILRDSSYGLLSIPVGYLNVFTFLWFIKFSRKRGWVIEY